MHRTARAFSCLERSEDGAGLAPRRPPSTARGSGGMEISHRSRRWRAFRIDPGKKRAGLHGPQKQHIAQLLFDCRRRSPRPSWQLLHLFVELVHRAGDVRPVQKPVTGGLRLKSSPRAHRPGRTMGRTSFHRLRGGSAVPFSRRLSSSHGRASPVAEGRAGWREIIFLQTASATSSSVKRRRGRPRDRHEKKRPAAKTSPKLLAQAPPRPRGRWRSHHLPRLLQHLGGAGDAWRLRGRPHGAAARRARSR